MWVQVMDGVVTLIGDEAVGLPLPEEFLAENPEYLCIDAAGLEGLPKIGERWEMAENWDEGGKGR